MNQPTSSPTGKQHWITQRSTKATAPEKSQRHEEPIHTQDLLYKGLLINHFYNCSTLGIQGESNTGVLA